jgi:hypothetical protein
VVIVLGISHLVTSWRLQEVADENRKLRSELGLLDIDDPRKIHAIQVPTVESMSWKWRLHLPAQRKCSLQIVTQDIPEKGFPTHGAWGFTTPEEPFTLTVAMRRDHLGQWQVVATDRGGTMRTGIPDKDASWLIKSDGYVSQGVGIGETQRFALGQPVELLRLRVYKRNPGGGSSPPKEPCQGLLVWLKVE